MFTSGKKTSLPEDNEPSQSSAIFSLNNLLNIRKITHVNGHNIYQIAKDNCLAYISPKTDYICLIDGNAFRIFNLVEDGVFPENFRRQFEFIDRDMIKALKADIDNELNPKSHELVMKFYKITWAIDSKLRKYIKYIRLGELTCPKLMDLSSAKHVIDELNAELNKTCGFKLSIDYGFDFKDQSTISTLYKTRVDDKLFLCLFDKNHCVSSLALYLDGENKLNIDCSTAEHYQKRQFIKLLVSVAIMIAQHLDETIQFIFADAVSPISAYTLLKNFNAVIDTSNPNYIHEYVIDDKSSFQEITRAMISNDSIHLNVELNDENVENAETVFDKTIESIVCQPTDWVNPKRIYNHKIKKSKHMRASRRSSMHSSRHSLMRASRRSSMHSLMRASRHSSRLSPMHSPMHSPRHSSRHSSKNHK